MACGRAGLPSPGANGPREPGSDLRVRPTSLAPPAPRQVPDEAVAASVPASVEPPAPPSDVPPAPRPVKGWPAPRRSSVGQTQVLGVWVRPLPVFLWRMGAHCLLSSVRGRGCKFVQAQPSSRRVEIVGPPGPSLRNPRHEGRGTDEGRRFCVGTRRVRTVLAGGVTPFLVPCQPSRPPVFDTKLGDGFGRVLLPGRSRDPHLTVGRSVATHRIDPPVPVSEEGSRSAPPSPSLPPSHLDCRPL